MIDQNELLKRQAAWQRTRAKLTWAEKINSATQIRDDIASVRQQNNKTHRLKLTDSNE